jgi:hypothetical protein
MAGLKQRIAGAIAAAKEAAEDRRMVRDEQRERLIKAAGISSAPLICHRHTWGIIMSETAASSSTFVRPSADEVTNRGNDMVEVRCSGPNLVAILCAMSSVASFYAEGVPVRAVAIRVYGAISNVVDRVDLEAEPGSVSAVVIDAAVSSHVTQHR